MLFMTLSLVLFTANVYAETPRVPLANITVYQLFYNMGAAVDTRRPAAMTPDGYPIYGTGLPLKPLMQSQEFANTLVISNPKGNAIHGIKLFFNARGNKSDMVNVLSKFVKALDENIYNEMGADWVSQQLNEFLSSYIREDKLISCKSMNICYKFRGSLNNGVFTVNIEAERK